MTRWQASRQTCRRKVRLQLQKAKSRVDQLRTATPDKSVPLEVLTLRIWTTANHHTPLRICNNTLRTISPRTYHHCLRTHLRSNQARLSRQCRQSWASLHTIVNQVVAAALLTRLKKAVKAWIRDTAHNIECNDGRRHTWTESRRRHNTIKLDR